MEWRPETGGSAAPGDGSEGPASLPGDLERRLTALPGGGELVPDLRALVDGRTEVERALKRQTIAYSTVIEIANRINASGLDLRRIEAYTASMIRGQFGVLRVFLLRGEPTEDGRIVTTVPARTALGGLGFPAEGPLASWLTEQARPIPAAELAALAGRFPEVGVMCDGGMAVCVPLVHSAGEDRRELVGCLGVGEKLRGAPFGAADLELLALLSNMIAIALHNAHLYHRSIVDGLTRVYSRGHFDVHLVQELARARRRRGREEQPRATGTETAYRLTLVMLDIDHFKRVNDTWGHQTGDQVLRAIGHVLSDAVRTMDIVSRYGGEEFAIVFPETAKADGERIAERIRARIQAMDVRTPAGDPLPVTASLGIATFPEDAEEVRELVAAADKALYQAKAGGRNRVVPAPPRAVVPPNPNGAPPARRKDG